MSSSDGKIAMTEEAQKTANYLAESSSRNCPTRSAGQMPKAEKIPERSDEQRPIRYVVLAIPAPSQAGLYEDAPFLAEFYEQMTMQDEEAARKGKAKA